MSYERLKHGPALDVKGSMASVEDRTSNHFSFQLGNLDTHASAMNGSTKRLNVARIRLLQRQRNDPRVILSMGNAPIRHNHAQPVRLLLGVDPVEEMVITIRACGVLGSAPHSDARFVQPAIDSRVGGAQGSRNGRCRYPCVVHSLRLAGQFLTWPEEPMPGDPSIPHDALRPQLHAVIRVTISVPALALSTSR